MRAAPMKRELCHNVSPYGTAFRPPAARRRRALPDGRRVPRAQTKPLTVEDIYGYEGWKRFNGSQAATMTWVPAGDPWLSDTHHLWPAPSARRSPAERAVRAAGRGCASMPRRAQRAALYLRAARARARRGGRRRPTTRAVRRGGCRRSSTPTRDAFLITIGDDLYVYTISSATATRLTDSAGAEDAKRRSAPTAAAWRSSRTTIFSSRASDAHRRASADDGRQRRSC